MVFSNNLLLGAAGQASGYEIDQSIRFNDNDDAHLYNTSFSASPTSSTDCTFSTWVKRGNFGSYQVMLYGGNPAGSTAESIRFDNDEDLRINQASGAYNLKTDQKFRDVAGWYHIVVAFDTNNGTAGDRIKVYVNGDRITSFSTETYPSSGYSTNFTSGAASVAHVLGANAYEGSGPDSQHFDGYQAEIHFIDGTALAPTDFGEFNSDGVWIPKAYTGSYGTNGFYLTGATASDLGEDFSGNGNDFTSSGLATTDQMLDTPTNNFCTLSPIDKNSNVTLKDGNLVASAGGGWYHGRGTLFAPSGKWYYEWIPTAGSYAEAGWMLNVSGNDYAEEESDVATTFYRGVGAAGHGFRIGSSATDSAVTNFSLNDVIMMAIDVDTMKMWVGINGTWYNSGDPAGGTNPVGTWTAAIGESVAPWYGLFTSTSETFNFGQRPFAYTIPTGFNSWNTANLPTPSITDGSKYFNPVLFTGNSGVAFSVTGVGFQPDFVWGKPRSYADNHRLMDVVRGSTKQLITNATNAEFTQAQGITSFDSDGFTVGTHNGLNTGTNTYVAWNWLADNTTGSSNTDGSITSTASANTTAGFSIVKYVGNSTSGATVGHGLGVAPKMLILKDLSVAENWVIYNEAIGPTKFMYFTTDAAFTASNRWNDTAPTSSVFSLGNETQVNASGRNYIVYAFAEIPGYSSIGSYKGNGSATNGPFVYIGFKPKWIMYKSSSNAGTRWGILDTDRSASGGGNSVGDQLFAELQNAEANADHEIDFLSNGFKVRDASGSVNGNGYTITYIAFAENPFGGDGAAPATAR